MRDVSLKKDIRVPFGVPLFLPIVGKFGFVSHTKDTTEATNVDLFQS